MEIYERKYVWIDRWSEKDKKAPLVSVNDSVKATFAISRSIKRLAYSISATS